MKRASEVPPVVVSFGVRPGDLVHRACHGLDQRTGLGEEHVAGAGEA